MQFSRRGMLGGIVLATMGVASFRLGDSLGPDRSLGKNLYSPKTDSAMTASDSDVVLTGLSSGAPRSSHVTLRQASDNGSLQDVVTDGPGETFEEVYQLLKRNYVDWKEGVNDDSQLGHGAAAAMLASLGDPKSRFVDANQMKELQAEIDGTYHGIGAVTDVKTLLHGDPKSKTAPGYTEYRLTVVAPLVGSPAEKAGLKPGDVITEIGGKWLATYDPVAAATKQLKAVQDDPVAFNKLAAQIQKQVENAMSLSDGEDKLTQASTDPLVLTVERAGEPKPLTITLDVSSPTTVTPIVAKSLPNGIGYIHINQILPGSDKDFQTALDNFGNDLKGLVLDLRNTPGGQMAAAKEIAQKISNGKVFGIAEKKGKQTSVIALKSAKQINCPVVVLINAGTASTAELLASELRDSGSKLVGQTTFGDSMNVVPVVLRDGAGFTMTVGKFYTASHASFTTGIKPDIAVPATASPDELLNQAVSTFTGRVAVIPTTRG